MSAWQLRWLGEVLHCACSATALLFLYVCPAKSQLAQLWYCWPHTREEQQAAVLRRVRCSASRTHLNCQAQPRLQEGGLDGGHLSRCRTQNLSWHRLALLLHRKNKLNGVSYTRMQFAGH